MKWYETKSMFIEQVGWVHTSLIMKLKCRHKEELMSSAFFMAWLYYLYYLFFVFHFFFCYEVEFNLLRSVYSSRVVLNDHTSCKIVTFLTMPKVELKSAPLLGKNKVLNFVQHLMFVVQNVLQAERTFLNSVLNVFVNQVQQAYVTASTIPILVILL